MIPAHDDLTAQFRARGWVDDPFLGPVLPQQFLDHAIVAPGHPRWATAETLQTISNGERRVDEFLYTPADGGPPVPVAVVWDDATIDAAARVYYNKALIGGPDSERARPPLIPVDRHLDLHPTMSAYEGAIRSADEGALRALLAPTFRVRRPDGRYAVGDDVRAEFLASMVGIGGVPLQYLTSTDDGSRAANEFTSWRSPAHAGLGVYDRSPDGLITEFRSYEGPVYPKPGTTW